MPCQHVRPALHYSNPGPLTTIHHQKLNLGIPQITLHAYVYEIFTEYGTLSIVSFRITEHTPLKYTSRQWRQG